MEIMITCTISKYGAYGAKNLGGVGKSWLLVQFVPKELTVQTFEYPIYLFKLASMELTVQTFYQNVRYIVATELMSCRNMKFIQLDQVGDNEFPLPWHGLLLRLPYTHTRLKTARHSGVAGKLGIPF